MANSEVDLLAFDQISVTAPAGCGKTHLIVDALKRHVGSKPILVLTHTNAGVAALRERLSREGVPGSSCHISTIDGWAILLIQTFPRRSSPNQEPPDLSVIKVDYPSVRDAAVRLLRSGHISDILKSSYARLLVDEYQDCSVRQHHLISSAADVVPTNILGDPMQAIFGFDDRDRLADWSKEVLPRFPLACELDVPHRWIKAEKEPLGEWLLDVRDWLKRGISIDLQLAPAGVDWIDRRDANADKMCLQKAEEVSSGGDGSIIMLADSTSPQCQQRIARETPDAVTVEAVGLRDLMDFANRFNPCSQDAPRELLAFAKKVTRNIDAESIIQRVDSLRCGMVKNQASKVENAMLLFTQSPSLRSAAAVLEEVKNLSDSSVYRPVILHSCLRALQICRDGTTNFYDAAIQAREENSLAGRRTPGRAVGSTLLLKGLEADVAVVLNASDLDARNLYVAMTRGTKKVVVCAKSKILKPFNSLLSA